MTREVDHAILTSLSGEGAAPSRRSPVPEVAAAEPTLVSLLLAAADRWPDLPAWTFDDGHGVSTVLTFHDVERRTAQLAQALRSAASAPATGSP